VSGASVALSPGRLPVRAAVGAAEVAGTANCRRAATVNGPQGRPSSRRAPSRRRRRTYAMTVSPSAKAR
jgi:hypothetical protein